MIRWFVLAAFLVGGAVDPVEPSFRVFHMDSVTAGEVFDEHFVVLDAQGRIDWDDVEFRVDGEPVHVQWIEPGQRFVFTDEAFDRLRFLSAPGMDDCAFGGGAAFGLSPDEWIEVGHPEQIRCLDHQVSSP